MGRGEDLVDPFPVDEFVSALFVRDENQFHRPFAGEKESVLMSDCL